MGDSDSRIALAPTVGAETVPAKAPDVSAGPAQLQIGTSLGKRYAIRGYLGEGGMGAVYRAHDGVLGIEVALKSVRGTFANDEQLREEVRVAQRITHPNVCRIYDLVDVDGRHFIKMEYIAGETLATRLARDGKLPVAEAMRIARAVADGLAAAHDKSIIHRDLKPSNVMLADRRIVLMDFGLARAVAEASADRSGTPSYMSPEQLAGKDVDASSDLFALGCLLYEMLAGRRAFSNVGGSYTQLASARPATPPPVLSTVRQDVPRWLVRATSELLADDRAVRGVGLARLQRGPRRALAAAAVVVGVAATSVLVWWLLRPPQPWRPVVEQVYAYPGNADGAAVTADGTRLLLTQDPENAERWGIYELELPGGRPRLLSPDGWRCGFGRWSRDERSALAACVRDGQDRIFRFARDGGAPEDLGPGLGVDDCGDALAILVGAGPVTLVLQKPDGERDVVLEAPTLARPRCSPSGREVAVIQPYNPARERGDLLLIDRATRKSTKLAESAVELTFVTERRVVFTSAETTGSALVELDLESGARRSVTPEERLARGPDFAPGRGTLLFNRDETWIPISEVSLDGEKRHRTIGRDSLYGPMTPVPGTNALVATRFRRAPPQIVVVDLESQEVRLLADGARAFPSRDGKDIFVVTHGDGPRLQIIPFAGGTPREIAALPGDFIEGADTIDGTQLAISTAGKPETWLVTGGGLSRANAAGIVLSATAGGWRAIWSPYPNEGSLALVPPGKPLGAPSTTLRGVYGRPAWIDARRISYCDLTSCKVLDVESGIEQRGPKSPTRTPNSIAAGLDGKRWFYTTVVAQVTLHEVVNFADRER